MGDSCLVTKEQSISQDVAVVRPGESVTRAIRLTSPGCFALDLTKVLRTWLTSEMFSPVKAHLRALTAHVELRTGYFQPALRCAKGSLLLNFVQGGNN